MSDRERYCVRVQVVGQALPTPIWVDAPSEAEAIRSAVRAPDFGGQHVTRATVQRFRPCSVCDGAGQIADTPERAADPALLDELMGA